MSDTSTDSDDTSLTDWSLVDKHGNLDESDSLSTTSSIEVLEEDEEEEVEDDDEEEEEKVTPIQGRSPIGIGPVFILRLSSRESVKRDHKSEGDTTVTSSISESTSAPASIEMCPLLSSKDFRKLQENPTAIIHETASPKPGSGSLEYVKGDNSYYAEDPYKVEEIVTCADGSREGQDGRETVDPIETVDLESVGSPDERQISLPDFLALIPETESKTGDEVKPLTTTMLVAEVKMESQSVTKTEFVMESTTVADTEHRTKAETQTQTEAMNESQNEIRTECVNETEIGLQTETKTEYEAETKNKTSDRLRPRGTSSSNKFSEFTKKIWSWLLVYLNDRLAEWTLKQLCYLLLILMMLTCGIAIGYIVASRQLRVPDEHQIKLHLMHNDLQRCQEKEKEIEKDKLIAVPPSDIQLHSDRKAIPELELQKEEKPDSVSQSENDCLLTDPLCPILVQERYSPEKQDDDERGFCYRQIHRVEGQNSHMDMENTKSEPLVKSKPLVNDLVQTDHMKNLYSDEAFIDTDLTELDTFDNFDEKVVDFPKSQIVDVKEKDEKNETKNVHGSDERESVIVEEADDDDSGVDTEVDEDEREDSTDLSEDEDNHEDNDEFDDDDDESYVNEDDFVEEYDPSYDPHNAHLDPKRDSSKGQQTGRNLDSDHKSVIDSSSSYNSDPKHAKLKLETHAKLKLETGGRQEEESKRSDKENNSEGPNGKRENKWMDTVLDMWNKTRASVTNVTKQIQETWQQVKNLSVDLWEKNQPYVEKLQQKLGNTVEKASQCLQKKFQKATQKINKVTRRWFRSKDNNDVDVAKDDIYEDEAAIHLGHAKTSRRPFKEEVKKDGSPKRTNEEKKRDQAAQPPQQKAHVRKAKPDRNLYEKMEKGSPQHKHDTKFNRDHGSYGHNQRGRRPDTTREQCGGHSKHIENKFKRSCKKNVHTLFRDVNRVNRVYLSRPINMNAGDQIFDSFSKFRDQFGLDVLADKVQNWFKCQSYFWESWGVQFYGGLDHHSPQGIKDEICVQYLTCWQIKELPHFTAQKCQKEHFWTRMKKLLKDPCANYQPGECERTMNTKWDSKPIEKPQMPDFKKDGDYFENKREKKQADLHKVSNTQREKLKEDASDSKVDEDKNLNTEGDWYLKLADEREFSRIKSDWYLRRLERSNDDLEAEHNVKQESDWLFERAAERQILRADNEYIKNLDE